MAFRKELDSLLTKLKQTVCKSLKTYFSVATYLYKIYYLQRSYFIRCIKPNNNQTAGIFDENVVLKQIQTSGTLTYFNLMQHGYPFKVRIDDLFENITSFLEPRHISVGSKMCCQIYLIATGFEHTDFKLGKTEIHIRLGKNDLFNQLRRGMNNASDISICPTIAKNFRKGFVAFMFRALLVQIRFVGKREHS